MLPVVTCVNLDRWEMFCPWSREEWTAEQDRRERRRSRWVNEEVQSRHTTG